MRNLKIKLTFVFGMQQLLRINILDFSIFQVTFKFTITSGGFKMLYDKAYNPFEKLFFEIGFTIASE